MKKSLLTLALAGLLVAPTAVYAIEGQGSTDEPIEKYLARQEAALEKKEDAERVVETATFEEELLEPVTSQGANDIFLVQGPQEPQPGAQGSTAKPEDKKAEETPAPAAPAAKKEAKEVKAAATKTGAKTLPKTSAAK